jgi:HD-GYP domain-containing protein (c-di-GMP phosphodiesterase class II)
MAPEREPYQLNVEMARLGKSLVAQLFVLIKTSFHYGEGHLAIDIAVGKVLEVVREIQRKKEEASLRVKGSHLYLGEYRLKSDATGFEAATFIMQEMKSRLIGRISFSPEVTAEEVRRFIYALREADEGPSADAYARVLQRMQQRMVNHIEVETLPEEAEVKIDRRRLQSDRERARLFYHKAVSAMEEVMASAKALQPVRFRDCKRVVQQLIDLLPTQESTLLALASNRCRESYGENHAANVCVLSLALGKRLGMSKFHLCELGMAALFHDIGKADLPREILDKPEELTAEEQRMMEAHPLLGVRKLLKLKALDTMTARIITCVFEHHLMADHSGYPQLGYRRFSLFSRIISLADNYDSLTSSRVGSRTAYPPEKAIRFMLTRGGKEYDQALLKVLVSCVGLYGIGSLVLLDTRELAVVVENHRDPALLDLPRVRLLSDDQGREADGEMLDLAHATPPRRVAAALDAAAWNLDLSRYLY